MMIFFFSPNHAIDILSPSLSCKLKQLISRLKHTEVGGRELEVDGCLCDRVLFAFELERELLKLDAREDHKLGYQIIPERFAD